MKFTWANADVKEKLQQRKDGQVTVKDVQAFLSENSEMNAGIISFGLKV